MHWILVLLFFQIIHFLSTWKLYSKAGRKSWEAIIPVYSAIVLMQIINRPKWWVILLFIPVINLIMFPVIWIETIRSFGEKSYINTFLVVLTLGLYIAYVNYNSDNLIHIKDRDLKPNSILGEWVGSIAFAIIAATLVHTYVMQPFTIPTSSLEKTLLVGDFLFVSKIHYGPRVPMTTVAAPMVHDTIPIIKTKSYLFSDDFSKKNSSFLNKLQLPYLRFPGFQSIKRNDIVVFNQPADTLLDMNNFKPDRNYYKPIDKKTNLVKRCVGIPGDSLEIRNGYVFINGKSLVLPKRAKLQFNFFVDTKGQRISQKLLTNRYGAGEGLQYANGNFALNKKGGYILTLTDEEAKRISKNPKVKAVKKLFQFLNGEDGDVFPRIPSLGWNMDNFGPIYIPKKGNTVKLDKKSLPFYKRIIQEYENNDFVVFGDSILINGRYVDSYTFKQDYYWMMGDNRQNSLDARLWGYVPFDHVVGKPVLIWLSIDKNGKGIHKIRWNRMFTTVGGNENPKSYLVHVGIFFLSMLGFSKYKKRKLKKN